MSNQCKFKVGDKVKRKDGKLFTNSEKVVTVSDILCWYGHYWVEYANKRTYLHEDELELSVFTKADLKDGMVVTYRQGGDRVLFKGKFYSVLNLKYSYDLIYFNEDLTSESEDRLDIMKVTYMDEVLWEREEETAEQKRIKELEEGIAKASLIIKGQQGDTQELQEFLNKLI